jgi:eukaryotic-like serine/threonine-protein kinase
MIGRTLLHYTITEQLGEGGMGIVYKARDKRLNRVVVVKTLRPDKVEDPEKKKRFIQEAQAASALNHPNIVTIHDIASVDGLDLMVMEYVQGQSLDCIIAAGGLTIETTVKYAIQITNALEAAHSSGIIHRDLKPGNIMVTPKGLVKLLDFGLAKLTEKPKQGLEVTTTVNVKLPSTAEGALVGTIAYMSPEQALADTLDPRSDLFSFGSVLYEMVTGQRAFQGASAIATLCAVLREEPKLPALLNSRISPALDKLIVRCLQKRPEDRLQTAGEVRGALEGLHSDIEAPKSAALSMAVLPFANLSGDPRMNGVCEGLPKDIAGALTRVASLRVTVPSAAGIGVERPLDAQAIGRKLRADIVLDGNVRTAGGRVRITAELVSAADGYHLWSERYDRDAFDMFALQDDICRDIVHRVRKHLRAGKSIGGGEADRFYADGRAHLDRFTSDSLPKAKECFEHAVGLQKDSPAVYAAISEYYLSAALLGIRPSPEAMAKAEWAARKALSIDPNAERAHACLGMVYGLHEYSWEESAESFRRALQINPGSGSIRQTHALWHLIPLGRIAEAIAEMEKALQAEPGSARRLAVMGYVCYLNREFDEAVRLCRVALALDERFWLAHWVLSWALMAQWENELALQHARAALAEEAVSGWTRAAYAVASSISGDPQPARSMLAAAESQPNASLLAWTALVMIGTGDADRAFRLAARAVQERNAMIPAIMRHGLFDRYRSDARYEAVVGRMRLNLSRGV